MRVLISSAKTLDYDTPSQISNNTQPRFLEHSQESIDNLKRIGPNRAGKLMKFSKNLSELNVERYRRWQ